MTARAPLRAVGPASALVCVALLVGAAPRTAAAQASPDVEAARAYFLEASKLGAEGRWKEARELYARSLQLKAAPITRYSLGVAQKETGRLADALASFRAFLAEPSTPATAPYMAPARAAIAALEAKVGRFVVVVEPQPVEGLALAIDGQPAPPATERPREIEPGAHEVVGHAPGFLRASAWFNVAAGANASVTLTFARAPAAVVPLALTGPAADTHRRPDARAPLAPTDVAHPSPDRTGPAVLMGVGGGVFLVGLTVGLLGVSQASHATTQDGDDASAARAKGIAGDVLGGVGIATAVVGLGWLLAQGRATAPRIGAATLAIGARGPGLSF